MSSFMRMGSKLWSIDHRMLNALKSSALASWTSTWFMENLLLLIVEHHSERSRPVNDTKSRFVGDLSPGVVDRTAELA